MAARFKADAVDGRIHHGLADDLLDLLCKRGVSTEVNGLATEAPGLLQTLADHISDDDDSSSEQLGSDGTRQPDRSGARDVDDGAGADTRGYGAVKASGKDVRDQREIADL